MPRAKTGTSRIKKGSPYSLHPSYAMLDVSRQNLLERTGKTIEQWAAFVKKSGPAGPTERRNWLMKQHGISTNYAWWVVEAADGMGGIEDYDPDSMIEEMFAGAKASLRPIYDRLLKMGLDLGEDVKVCPCKTIVPFYRKHVFAEVKPATNSRIDFGFCLGDTKPSGRLLSNGRGPMADRITHRIPIAGVEEIDKEVERWLRVAYERADPTREKTVRKAPAKEVKLPADLKAAIAKSAKAQATFDGLTSRMRADWIAWVESAKQAETRARRISIAAEKLAAGKKQIY